MSYLNRNLIFPTFLFLLCSFIYINVKYAISFSFNLSMPISRYYIIVMICIIFVYVYNYKIEYCPYDFIIISLFINLYVILGYSGSIITSPINILTIFAIYGISLFGGSVCIIIINLFKNYVG